MRVVFRSSESKKYPLANICEYRYFFSRISIKKLTLLENFVAKNYENIQNYEKECRFQVSHWSAVLCRTYVQFSCAWACTCVFFLKPPTGKMLATLGGRSFQAAAPQLWNALPPSLRDAASVETFKKNLKIFLFRKAYADRFTLNKF